MKNLTLNAQAKYLAACQVFKHLLDTHNIKIANPNLKISARLKRAGGHTQAVLRKSTGEITVKQVTIAKFILEDRSMDAVLEVVYHEIVHCLLYNTVGNHSHDEVFLKACIEVGAVPNKYLTKL